MSRILRMDSRPLGHPWPSFGVPRASRRGRTIQDAKFVTDTSPDWPGAWACRASARTTSFSAGAGHVASLSARLDLRSPAKSGLQGQETTPTSRRIPALKGAVRAEARHKQAPRIPSEVSVTKLRRTSSARFALPGGPPKRGHGWPRGRERVRKDAAHAMSGRGSPGQGGAGGCAVPCLERSQRKDRHSIPELKSFPQSGEVPKKNPGRGTRPGPRSRSQALAARPSMPRHHFARWLTATLPRISVPAIAIGHVSASPRTSQAHATANSGTR
jgi:hypothetical protein